MPKTSPGAPAPSTQTPQPRTSPGTARTEGLQRPRSPSVTLTPDGKTASGPERLLTGDLTWQVQDVGVRCVAAPCPTFRATRIEGKKTHPEEALHEVDFSRAKLSEREQARAQARLANGLRVEGRVRWVPNRGPAGGARILEVRRILATP